MKSMFILFIVAAFFMVVSLDEVERCYSDTNPAIIEQREKLKLCDPPYNESNDVVTMNKIIIKCALKPEGIVDENDQLDVEKYRVKEGIFIVNESKREAINGVLDACANGTNTVDALTYLNCFEEKIWEVCPND